MRFRRVIIALACFGLAGGSAGIAVASASASASPLAAVSQSYFHN